MQTQQHTCPSPDLIEAILGREPIVLDPEPVSREMSGKNILVTGAAGTIGSGLAWALAALAPARLILLDHSETALYDLDQRLTRQFPRLDLHTYVANVSDALRMSDLFSRNSIHTIFHAAAYKHVPFMERHPYEAIKTNILGTEILADLAVSHGTAKFVFVSTDKAIRPASVMGATKRFAEIYLQYLSHEYRDSTRFIITRFGNVLGSSGSFLLRFTDQIAAGGPVTVTHPEAERYLMTVHEACQLVLQAAAMSNGREILSFDMGKPVRIMEVARQMIELSHSDQEICIQLIGLRPGEKLTESPASQDFTRVADDGYLRVTAFPQSDALPMRAWMSGLQKALDSGQPERMVAALKSCIPEYVSTNSPFGTLDTALTEPCGLLCGQKA